MRAWVCNLRGNMELNLRKIGNSYGVILPAEVLKALNVKDGSKLTLLPNEKGYQLSVEDVEFEEQMRAALQPNPARARQVKAPVWLASPRTTRSSMATSVQPFSRRRCSSSAMGSRSPHLRRTP